MPLLENIRGLFKRRRPVIVDLSADLDEFTHNEHDQPAGSKGSVAQRSTEQTNGLNGHHGNGSNGVTRVRGRADQQNAIDEVVGMVRRISSHLEGQADRTDRLLDVLETLPRSLDALPEITRQNARLHELISDHLEHTRKHDSTLNDTLTGIRQTSAQQTEVLGLLQQHLDADRASTESLLESLGQFRMTLGDLATSNARTADVLARLNDQNERHEQDLARILGATQRWMIVAICCSAAAAAGAIVVSGVALFRLVG